MKFHMLLSLFLVLFASFLSSSNCYTFNVDWVLHPKEKYNDWAGKMRFQVNDTIIFKYEKGSDSVLLVQKDDYDKCERKEPLMEMNNGSSEFKYPHSGPFYFISGKEGHCQKGQKMITVVMAVRHGTPPTAPSPNHHGPVAKPPTGSSPVPALAPGPVTKPPTGSSPVPALAPGPVAKPPTGSSPVPALAPGPVTKPPTGSSPVPALAPGPVAKPPTGSSPVPALAPGPIAKPPTALTPGPAQSPYHHGPISKPPTASSPAPYSGPALSPTLHGPSPSPTAEGPTATPPSSQAPTAPVSSPPGVPPVSGPPAPPQGPSSSPPAGSQAQTSTPPAGSPPKSSATSTYSSIAVLAASLLFNMV